MIQNGAKAILCIDDEPTGLYVRKALLETQGYRVFAAKSGDDALSLIAAEAIDLVVLDYAMPGMEGRVVAREIKKLRPGVPIIMLSAYVDLPAETLGLVDACVTKGEPTSLLLEAVSRLIDNAEGEHTRRAG